MSVRLGRNCAPLLSQVSGKPRKELPTQAGPAKRKPSPDFDASPEATDDEEENTEDTFQDISELEAADVGEHTKEHGKSDSHGSENGKRKSDTMSEDSLKPRKRQSKPQAYKTNSSPTLVPPPVLSLEDVSEKRVFAAGGSQPKTIYSRKNTSSQPTTQLHGESTKRNATKDDKAKPDQQFQVPPTLPKEPTPETPKFIQPRQWEAKKDPHAEKAFVVPPHQLNETIDLVDDDSSSLSSARSSPSRTSVVRHSDNESPRVQSRATTPMTSSVSSAALPTTVPCPMCKALVDRKFLESFGNGQRLRSRQALRFCEAHQQRTAEEQWVTTGYPTIDWNGLEKRLVKLHDDVLAILEQSQPSTYRERLEGRIAAGVSKSVLRDPLGADSKHCLPGYYGSRGGRIMAEHIMTKLGKPLRQKSRSDKIFKVVGMPGYVQAVLVPEMARRLVMEDMNLDIDEAQRMMEESAAIGELLNAELEEDIVDDDNGDGMIAVNQDDEEENHLEEDQHDVTSVTTSKRRTTPRKKKRKEIEVLEID